MRHSLVCLPIALALLPLVLLPQSAACAERENLLREYKETYHVGEYPKHMKLLQGYRLEVGREIAGYQVASFEYRYGFPYFVGTTYQLSGPLRRSEDAHGEPRPRTQVLLEVHRTCQEAMDRCLLRWGRSLAYRHQRGDHSGGKDVGDFSLVTGEGLAFVRRNVAAYVTGTRARGQEGRDLDAVGLALSKEIDTIANRNGVAVVAPPRMGFDLWTEEALAYWIHLRVSASTGVEFDWRAHVSSSAGIQRATVSRDAASFSCDLDVGRIEVEAFAISRDGFVARFRKSLRGPRAVAAEDRQEELDRWRRMLEELGVIHGDEQE